MLRLAGRVMALLCAVMVVGLASSAVALAGALADGRSYELVSPPAKNGADVIASSQGTQISSAGDAVMFSSLGGFGDVVGTGVQAQYLSERSSDPRPGSNGWVTHGITPPQQPTALRGVSGRVDATYLGEFSSDLSSGVFRAWSPLTDDPNVAGVVNLYARSGLRADLGSELLVTECPLCEANSTPLAGITDGGLGPVLAAATPDVGHVLFESAYRLVAGATANPLTFARSLYEWDHGTLRLAGVLPNGSVASRSQAGQGAWWRSYPSHTLSADGRRIIFTDTSSTTDGFDGALYMRVDNGTPNAMTLQLNASERTTPDPLGAKPATYWDASTDGLRVFFTSSQALTDDAPSSSEGKLYMYDASKPASDPHNLTLISPDNKSADGGDVRWEQNAGVIGASADGHSVYFIARGQLVADEPLLPLQDGIYLWRDGVLRFIGHVADAARNTPHAIYDFQGGKQSRVSPDGGHVVFVSKVDPATGMVNQCSDPDVPNDGGPGCQQVYVYSAASGVVQCASCVPGGGPGDAQAFTSSPVHPGPATVTVHLNRALSDDGRYVFFSTAAALLPEDVNGRSDAYEFDTTTGALQLLSDGSTPSDSYFLDATADGSDALIATRERLVGWDTDGNYDVYDARLAFAGHPAGFPEPAPAAPGCTGDGCQAAPSGPPEDGDPASSAFFGVGNVIAPAKPPARKPVRCKKGFVRAKRVSNGGKRHVVCVKKTKKRPAKRSRTPIHGGAR